MLRVFPSNRHEILCSLWLCYGPYQNSGRINAARAVLILTGESVSFNAARAQLTPIGYSA